MRNCSPDRGSSARPFALLALCQGSERIAHAGHKLRVYGRLAVGIAARRLRPWLRRHGDADVLCELPIGITGRVVRRDLEDCNLVLGRERDDEAPSIEVGGAKVRPRRWAAQRVVGCATSLPGELLEDRLELGAQDDGDMLSVFERAANTAERELRRRDCLLPRGQVMTTGVSPGCASSALAGWQDRW